MKIYIPFISKAVVLSDMLLTFTFTKSNFRSIFASRESKRLDKASMALNIESWLSVSNRDKIKAKMADNTRRWCKEKLWHVVNIRAAAQIPYQMKFNHRTF